MIVTEYLDLSKPLTLTPEGTRMLDELDNYPIEYDDDCPPITREQAERYFVSLPQRSMSI